MRIQLKASLSYSISVLQLMGWKKLELNTIMRQHYEYELIFLSISRFLEETFETALNQMDTILNK